MENSFIKWLKKIFTVQSFALVISIATVVITWKQLYISDSSDLQLKIYSPLYSVNVTDKEICNIYKYIGRDTFSIDQIFPHLANETNRSVKNVSLKIITEPYNCYFLDSNGDSIKLNPDREYFFDISVLPALSVRPLPFDKVVITDSLYAFIKLYLYVTYDGIDKAITYNSDIELHKIGSNITNSPANYIQWRNMVFDDICKEFGTKSKTDDEFCFVIGDTIIPSVNNIQIFNRKESQINSLNDILEYTSLWEIILIFIAIAVFIYFIRLTKFLIPLITALKDNFHTIRNLGIKTYILNTKKEIEVYQEISSIEAWIVVLCAIPATIFVVFVIIYSWVNWSEING